MFLNTFTGAGELIYVRTKDYLFSNLRSRVFDFLEKREKKTPDTFFVSQEANRTPAIKNLTSTRSVIMTWKRLATKCFTIQLLWEKARLLCYVIFHVKLVANELRLKPFNNLCLTFRICPSSGYWSKIFFNCWISDGWIRLKPEEKPSLATHYIGFLARISRVINYLKCFYHRHQLLFLSLSLLSQLW